MIRAVLDENTPRPIAGLLRSLGFDVSRFPDSWKGTRNGRLLSLVESAGYAALISCDQSIPFQQDMRQRRFALIILSTNNLPMIAHRIDRLAEALRSATPGDVTEVDFRPPQR